MNLNGSTMEDIYGMSVKILKHIEFLISETVSRLFKICINENLYLKELEMAKIMVQSATDL